MPSHCSAPRCTNRSDSGYSLFHFPKNEDRRREWLQNIIRKVPWKPLSHHRLCEVHFEPSMIQFVGTRKELKSNSVPTLFCGCNTLTEHSCMLTEHSYAKVERPSTRIPLGPKHDNSNCTSPLQSPARKRHLSDKENHGSPARQRRTNYQHLPLCSVLRPPLKELPPTPNPPLPKADPEDVKELMEENTRLKQQLSSLLERAKLVSKIISTDQLRALKLGHHRGVKWSSSSLIEGLSLQFTCEDQGYNQLRKKQPLPSPRCLRRALQRFDFEPAVLHIVFKSLQYVVPKMRIIDRNCVIVFDEMSIQSRMDLDCSTGCYTGTVTLPGGTEDECACKALAFMVNGLAKRYKQVVAYHFCGAKGNTHGTAEVLMDVLSACDKVGLNVVGLVCDMGNRGILKELGFRFEKDNIVYKVVNLQSFCM